MSSVSVALCTHQGARYIAEQIDSILRQTTPIDEIVVSDDASVDGTVGIIRSTVDAWAGESQPVPRLVVLRNDVPLGVTANFEQALAACTGELIALCDQDDVWRPDKVAVMAARFADDAALVLLGSDARVVGADGAPQQATLLDTLGVSAAERQGIAGDRVFDVLVRRNIVTGATVMLSSSLLAPARPFPASWVHDEWLAVVASLLGHVRLLDETLIDYRQHGGNQIGVTALRGAGRLARLRAPRTERNARLLARASALAARIGDLTADPEPFVLAQQKQRHEQVRSSLPESRVRRVGPVLREWRSGRYSRFGRGAQDVLRDLVQPV